MGPTGIDDKVLGRVRALLAKAESTDFPEEAEALTAKAHELMARYAIDRVLLDTAGRRAGGPGLHRLTVDPPYPSAKFVLLSRISGANRCKAIWDRDGRVATVIGFPVDVETVEILYTSLLIQATTAMLGHGAQADVLGRSRTRAFRHAFLLAFGERVGQRLAEQTARAEQQAASQATGTDLVPVLAERKAEVAAAAAEAFPDTSRMRASASSSAGVRAGRDAADRADLSGRGNRLAS
jgi:hypothetical protein